MIALSRATAVKVAIGMISAWFLWYVLSDKRRPVETPEAAINKAKGVWEAIHEKTKNIHFSKEWTEQFEPFKATLVKGSWVVEGTYPDGYNGCGITATIRKDTGFSSAEVVCPPRKRRD